MQGREPNCLTHVVRLRRDVSVELEWYDWLRGLTIGQHLDPFLLVVVLCWGSLVSRELGPICTGCALACGVQVLQTKKNGFKHSLWCATLIHTCTPTHRKTDILPDCAVEPSVVHTYSFAFIVVQRGVLIVWARQCREVLVMDGEILCLFSWWLCHHANLMMVNTVK